MRHRVIKTTAHSAWRSASLLLAIAVAWTTSAKAEPTFPGEIQKHLQMSETPPCTLCHATVNGGGPIVTRFAQNMVGAGLDPSDDSSVARALDKLEKDGIDSNGDHVPDVEELRQNIDPNTGQPLSGGEKFGCGARVATGGVHTNAGLAVAAALAAMAFVGRRRGRRLARLRSLH